MHSQLQFFIFLPGPSIFYTTARIYPLILGCLRHPMATRGITTTRTGGSDTAGYTQFNLNTCIFVLQPQHSRPLKHKVLKSFSTEGVSYALRNISIQLY